jgi:hypothetical protein
MIGESCEICIFIRKSVCQYKSVYMRKNQMTIELIPPTRKRIVDVCSPAMSTTHLQSGARVLKCKARNFLSIFGNTGTPADWS